MWHIPYNPPREETSFYIDQALSHLDALRNVDQNIWREFLGASSVLALSGLRAQSPYHDRLSISASTRKALQQAMRKEDLLWVDENPHTPEYPSYSLVNLAACQRLADTYPLGGGISTATAVLEYSTAGFYAYDLALDISLARILEEREETKVWLTDWWTPHNLRFGMLLGYPAKVLESFVRHEIGQIPQQQMEAVYFPNPANIGADVSFLASKEAIQNEETQRVIELWRQVILGVWERCQ